jgi:hypothetical protein
MRFSGMQKASGLMKLFTETILLVALIAPFCGFAQTNTQSAESFLPKGSDTEAVYVEIERDPALDDYGRRIREAREKNPEWFLEYSRTHPQPNFAPAPYHENFGVSKEEYERFSRPMNHFREVTRKEIEIRRSNQNGHWQVDFLGNDLLLRQVVFLEDGTVKTPTDVLAKGEFVDVETASLPPGRHRGAHFRTPDAKIVASKRRESLLIGELKDKPAGIIHYSINTPGKVKMIYIQFQK